ncbi:kinase-like domain-containing protein [Rhizophagus clarus]|uniref:Kinase-like domain-containing protein n=1 Tax=Rhizophagus clarus TaxID=94130 RepID=A0A8H3QFG9_9GLOM|nr:kinase-like domain-containing protein [Rhizophagus clarus]
MKRCWDADPSERPNIKTLRKNIRELNLFYQSKSDDLLTQSDENNNLEINNVGSLKHYTRSTSRIHQFENLPEPRNATEEELDAFYSNSYDFYIPNNIDDFGQKSCILINEDDNENLSRVFNELSETNIQNNDYREETMQQQMKNIYIDDDGDEDEVYNNPNLHPGEQDELELPNDI